MSTDGYCMTHVTARIVIPKKNLRHCLETVSCIMYRQCDALGGVRNEARPDIWHHARFLHKTRNTNLLSRARRRISDLLDGSCSEKNDIATRTLTPTRDTNSFVTPARRCPKQRTNGASVQCVRIGATLTFEQGRRTSDFKNENFAFHSCVGSSQYVVRSVQTATFLDGAT